MKELKQQTEINGGTLLKVLPVQGCSLQEEEEEELHVNRQERNSLANRCIFTTLHFGKRWL
jgi:hypothetical protein